MCAAIEHGHSVHYQSRPTIADGLAVPAVGENTLAIVKHLCDGIVTVDEHNIALAVLRLIEMEKVVTEGAGAAALAALLAGRFRDRLAGKRVVLLVCGGNIDVTLLGRLIDHGLIADGRMLTLSCTISDRPGGCVALHTFSISLSFSLPSLHSPLALPQVHAHISLSLSLSLSLFSPYTPTV
eukprot:TRINITY_DN4875_c0_g1_i1.p1 TRINITY_DN4875_c0_g1~~TRINITY_DN4875_c0_g1_i1.p1  ORF type:complete len:182 (+),score=34.98 TRINITY_DN4875_c0_g1_i1:424-969(+)